MSWRTRTRSKRVTCEAFEQPDQPIQEHFSLNVVGQLGANLSRSKSTTLHCEQSSNFISGHHRLFGASSDQLKESALQPDQISNSNICPNPLLGARSNQLKAIASQRNISPNLNSCQNRQLGASSGRPKTPVLHTHRPYNLSLYDNNELDENPNQQETVVMQSNMNAAATCQETDVYGNSTANVTESVGNKKKRVRGATCMPKIWGQQSNELVVVSFNNLGQPKDQDKASTLSHFLGTIARNGKYCPLDYEDWRLMPDSYKQEMLSIVKAKFQLPPGHESYILRSINKKWRSWKSLLKSSKFDQDTPIQQQMTEIPERVDEDQYKSLVQHWMSDKSKRRSKKNKEARARLNLLHHMGKKSFAVMKENLREKYGRYPTRAELFEECYYKEDGSSTSEAVKEAIGKMKELPPEDFQNLDGDQITYNTDDSFAKVMRKDKEGQLRMYGLGVTPSDVYGKNPSRNSLLRQAMEYKTKYLEAMKKYDTLKAKLNDLPTSVHVTQPAEQHDSQSSPTLPNSHENVIGLVATPSADDCHRYIPDAILSQQVGPENHFPSGSNDQQSFRPNSLTTHIQVGSYVVLKSLVNFNEIVATGIVDEVDNVRVNGIEAGSQFCQVIIQCAVKKDERLVFPINHIQTIGNALGVPIAWPLSLVALDDEFHF